MNRIAVLALPLFALFSLAINAIAATEAWWIIALTLLAAMAVFTVIGHDVKRLMDDDGDDDAEPARAPAPAYDGAPVPPGPDFTGASGDRRAVVVAAEPMSAEVVLSALGEPGPSERMSVMVVAPRA